MTSVTKIDATDQKKRIDYPMEADTKFDSTPENFDSKIHKMIKKRNWNDDAYYYDHCADIAQEKVDKLRAEAAECRNVGSPKDRARIKRLKNMVAKTAELQKALEADGVDVAELLASLAS